MINVYLEVGGMKVAKWGNSLAVRLPASLVEALKIEVGDEIELTSRGKGKFEVSPDERRRQSLEEMRRLSVPMPAGYKFDREDANARGAYEPVEVSKSGSAAD
jgi:antitoxin MazE